MVMPHHTNTNRSHHTQGHDHTPQQQDCSLLCWLPDFFPAKEKRAYNSSSSSSSSSSGGRSYEGSASTDPTKLQSAFVHNWSSSSSPAPTGASRQAPAPIVFSHINQMFLRLGVERDKVTVAHLNTAGADVIAIGDEHLATLDSACLTELKRLIDGRPGGNSTNETLEWIAKTTSVFLAHSEVLQLQGKLAEAVAKVLQGMERLHTTAAAAVLPRRLVMLRQRDLALFVWGAQGGDFVCVEDRLSEAAEPEASTAAPAAAPPSPSGLMHVLGEAGLTESSGASPAMIESTSEQVSALLTPLASFHRRLGALYMSTEDYPSAERALGVYIAITKAVPPGADSDSARHLSHAYSLYAVVLDRLGRHAESHLFDELAVTVEF